MQVYVKVLYSRIKINTQNLCSDGRLKFVSLVRLCRKGFKLLEGDSKEERRLEEEDRESQGPKRG
jgi:hypothetical protein